MVFGGKSSLHRNTYRPARSNRVNRLRRRALNTNEASQEAKNQKRSGPVGRHQLRIRSGCHVEEIEQLLIDRHIQFDTGDQILKREPKIGCPQSQSRPVRIAINEVQKKLTKNRTCNVVYTDNLVVLLQAKILSKLKKKFKQRLQAAASASA